MTYKAIVRSVLEYAAPVWSPIISDSSWQKLQTVQNQALKIITGNLAMASEEHIHREAKILPIKDHCNMISKQFLLTNHVPGHPGYKHIHERLPARSHLKPTIQNMRQEIQDLLPVSRDNLKVKQKVIHTREVAKTLASYPPNKVLQANPPEVNKTAATLTRSVQSQLSQLRSGYSRLLNSYLHKIDNNIEDKCPQCNQSPHDTVHLFNCPNNPTNLTVLSLWTQPVLAANFLKLDEGVT